MRIVFFGTPSFAAEVFTFLVERGVDVVAVVTKPDRPKGRSAVPEPTAVKVIAQEKLSGIPLYQPERVSTSEYCTLLSRFKADLFVVVAYGEIISQKLLDIPFRGCINVHASLLPRYRGAAPIQRCLMNGDPISGVTIMYMEKKMDAGNIIRIREVPVKENMTAGELEPLLCRVGSESLFEVLQDLERGDVIGFPQDHSQATFAPKVELEDCEVFWNLPASDIHNLIRAVTPSPGAWCMVGYKGQRKRLKVSNTSVVKGGSGEPGAILSYGKEGIMIACGEDAVKLGRLQLEGKKSMKADVFVQGVRAESLHFYVA